MKLSIQQSDPTPGIIISDSQFAKLFEQCTVVYNANNKKKVTVSDLQTKCRKREVVTSRQWAMYFLKKYTKLSLTEIGMKLANSDHVTVLHSCKVVNNLYETNHTYREQLDEIEEYVKKLCGAIPTVNKDQKLAADRLTKITRLEQELYECTQRIRELELALRAANGEVRLYKGKMERALIPNRILMGE